MQPRLLVINITHYWLCFCWWASVHGARPGRPATLPCSSALLRSCIQAPNWHLQASSSPRHSQYRRLICVMYPLHRRTEKTEEGENTTTICNYVPDVFQSGYFLFNSSKEWWLSKPHNSILHKMNLLLYDLTWTRETWRKGATTAGH